VAVGKRDKCPFCMWCCTVSAKWHCQLCTLGQLVAHRFLRIRIQQHERSTPDRRKPVNTRQFFRNARVGMGNSRCRFFNPALSALGARRSFVIGAVAFIHHSSINLDKHVHVHVRAVDGMLEVLVSDE
jgi:hypothetical protein